MPVAKNEKHGFWTKIWLLPKMLPRYSSLKKNSNTTFPHFFNTTFNNTTVKFCKITYFPYFSPILSLFFCCRGFFDWIFISRWLEVLLARPLIRCLNTMLKKWFKYCRGRKIEASPTARDVWNIRTDYFLVEAALLDEFLIDCVAVKK